MNFFPLAAAGSAQPILVDLARSAAGTLNTMPDPQTTVRRIWAGRFCYAILRLPFFFGLIIIGGIDGAKDAAEKWIEWTPKIWREMH
jgi:hypothetical protein